MKDEDDPQRLRLKDEGSPCYFALKTRSLFHIHPSSFILGAEPLSSLPFVGASPRRALTVTNCISASAALGIF